MSSKLYLMLTIILTLYTTHSLQNSIKAVTVKSEVDDLNVIPQRGQSIQKDPVQNYPIAPGPYPPPFLPPIGGGCPFCEPTVFSYCYEKQLHDACCCSSYGPFSKGLQYPGYGFPGIGYQCQFQDCSFLFANTCEESFLIMDCCCNSLK